MDGNAGSVVTVQNVLVKTRRRVTVGKRGGGRGEDDSTSSEDSSSEEEDDSEEGDARNTMDTTTDETTTSAAAGVEEERAYWLQRTLREAIYGEVKYAVVLRRCTAADQIVIGGVDGGGNTADWVVTNEACAVKELSWQHIQREQGKLAEDPIAEVSAMQYIKRCLEANNNTGNNNNLMDNHVMLPMDLLTDDRNLYSIMPYCNGGELFDLLDERNKFSEGEARYWMHQILAGLEFLQRLGISHRDMSLENLLVHGGGCLIIDMGMCLLVPREGNRRYLITPQGTCGKWNYISPEIAHNRVPFDGYAVDMWAVGVILFLMLTGFPPWERPTTDDERFKYMTNGYLVQMLTEWELGLTPDAMDLLQRMLWLDPRDRLSLEQVLAHPWMVNGPRTPPAVQEPYLFSGGG